MNVVRHRRSRPLLAPFASLVALGAVIAAAIGCGSDDHGPNPGEGDVGVIGPPEVSCGTDKGCVCEHPGESIDCRAYRKSGDYVACSPGKRLCGDDGRWGDCIGDRIAE